MNQSILSIIEASSKTKPFRVDLVNLEAVKILADLTWEPILGIKLNPYAPK